MENLLNFKTIDNIRDLGGLKTSDGKSIKKGLLFRSAALNHLSDEEYYVLKNELKLNLVIDFRTNNSFFNRSDNVHDTKRLHLRCFEYIETHPFTREIDMLNDEFFLFTYKGYALSSEAINAFKYFLRALVDNKEGSIIFHCTSGKDRTGIAAILIEYILGVPLEDCIKEHMKTFDYMYPKFKKEIDNLKNPTPEEIDYLYCLYLPKELYIRYWLKLVCDNFGSLDTYIRDKLEITPTDVLILKRKYLEG